MYLTTVVGCVRVMGFGVSSTGHGVQMCITKEHSKLSKIEVQYPKSIIALMPAKVGKGFCRGQP